MMNKILIILLFILTALSARSQVDIHSQYYFNELQLNPAMTGLMENTWRLKYFRRQMNHNDYSAVNSTVFADLKFMLNRQAGEYGLNIREFSGWVLGAGLMDHRVAHGLESDLFRADYLSLAVHKLLNKSNYLSFGIQPGYLRMYDERMFDLNAGLMFGSGQIECWTEDQFFRTQLGIAFYNLLSDYKHNDSTYFPGRRMHIHGGYLIKEPKHFNIFANAAIMVDSKTHFTAGANVLFFPIVHYRFYDRARLGLHYRSSNHLVFSGGLRFYGGSQKTISVDMTLSYDVGMGFIDMVPKYRNGFEFGIVLTPLRKCWSLSKC